MPGVERGDAAAALAQAAAGAGRAAGAALAVRHEGRGAVRVLARRAGRRAQPVARPAAAAPAPRGRHLPQPPAPGAPTPAAARQGRRATIAPQPHREIGAEYASAAVLTILLFPKVSYPQTSQNHSLI